MRAACTQERDVTTDGVALGREEYVPFDVRISKRQCLVKLEPAGKPASLGLHPKTLRNPGRNPG